MMFIISEDNPRDREFLYEALANMGKENDYERHDIRVTNNGEEALEYASQEDMPLVISDIQMQGMTGIELARRLWQRNAMARIILWTHYSDEIYLRTLQKIIPHETVYGYLLKNKPSETIRKAVITVFVEGQNWIDPEVRQVQARSQENIDLVSDAELEVLIDIALGLTDNIIAERRSLSRRGVQNRLKSLYQKLGVDNLCISEEQSMNSRSRAVNIAYQRGLINTHELNKEEEILKEWLKSENIKGGSKR